MLCSPNTPSCDLASPDMALSQVTGSPGLQGPLMCSPHSVSISLAAEALWPLELRQDAHHPNRLYSGGSHLQQPL